MKEMNERVKERMTWNNKGRKELANEGTNEMNQSVKE